MTSTTIRISLCVGSRKQPWPAASTLVHLRRSERHCKAKLTRSQSRLRDCRLGMKRLPRNRAHHKEAYRDQKGEQTMQSDAGMRECIPVGRLCHGVLFGDALERFSTVPQC